MAFSATLEARRRVSLPPGSVTMGRFLAALLNPLVLHAAGRNTSFGASACSATANIICCLGAGTVPTASLPPAGIALALALTENAAHSRLHQLDLKYCGLGDAAAAALGAALVVQGASSNRGSHDGGGGGLRELSLRHNKSIGEAGAFALAGGIRHAGAWLRSVDLSDTGVGADNNALSSSSSSTTALLLLQEAVEAWSLRHRSAGRNPKALLVNLSRR